jgi:putative ABC transport system permease protein
MNGWLQDIRFGFRMMLRSPGMTVIVSLSLALGIGVNTSMFSVVNAALVKPFPYSAPHELVAIWGRFLPSSGYDFPFITLSDPEALDLMEETKTLSGVAPYRWREVSLGGAQSEPERAWAIEVPPSWTSLLGVEPVLGRSFDLRESRSRSSCVALLTHDAWNERLGARAGAVGESIRVDGETCTVLGVMPEDFFFLDRRVKLFLPLVLDADPERRADHSLGAVGRLAPSVSIDEARAELSVMMDRWASAYPDHHAKGHFLILEPFHSDRVRNVRPALLVLMGAVGLVLLIACSNAASLLLGRAEARRREIALRAALGAGRARLVRQLLTESVLLAALGGGLGLLLSAWTLDAALALYPVSLPGAAVVKVDGTVLLFALALSAGTVFLFGLVPAISVSARRPKEALASGGRASNAGGRRVTAHRLLVVGEVGLSLTLLIGAGLLLRSFQRLSQVELGFEPEGVLTFSVNASPGWYPDASSVRRLQSDLLQRIGTMPGVEAAAALSDLPLRAGAPADDFLIENRPEPAPAETAYNADYLMVSPRIFETLRIPLRRGRGFSASDDEAAPLVAVINEAAAQRYWPGEDPLGRRIRYHGDGTPWITIAGIVGDVRSTRLDLDPRPAVYVPFAQSSRGAVYDRAPNVRSFTIVARAQSAPEELFPSIRAAVRERDPNLPLSSATPLTEVVARAAAAPRFTSLLMGIFAGTAVLLALVGIYGIVSFSVEEARQAIGIRMALGATGGDVLKLVVGEGALLGTAGAALGLVASFLLARSLTGMLYRVDPFDPATFALLTVLLCAVVLLASYLPARRAARWNVIEALRY